MHAGSPPRAMATSMGRPRSCATRSCSAEPLWICQCMPRMRSSNTWSRYMPTLREPVTGSRVKTMGRVMKRPASRGQHWRTGSDARLGRSVSTTSWQGAERARRGPALATSKRSPSLRSLSRKEPGMRRSRSLATRAPRSSRRSTPRAAAIRAGEPKALMRTGVSKPSTCSKRRARLASAGPLETRSVISAISRSRETLAATRVSCPCFSRWATKARRSSKATALLVIPELHEPARDEGEGEAGDDPHDDESPAHEGCLPRDDALHAEERPRSHVGDKWTQSHPGVREDDEERHAHHRPPGREGARYGGHGDSAEPRLVTEVARHRLLRDQHLEHAGQDKRGGKTRQDEPQHAEPVLGAQDGQRGIFPVREDRGDDGQSDQKKGGKVERKGSRMEGLYSYNNRGLR